MTSFSRTAHLQQVMLSCRMFAGGGLGHLATSVLHWFHGETTRKLHLYLLMDLSTMCLNDTLAAFQLLGFFPHGGIFRRKKFSKAAPICVAFCSVLHQTLRGAFAIFLQLPQLLHVGHVLFIHLEINQGNHWTISLKTSSQTICHTDSNLELENEANHELWSNEFINQTLYKKETRFPPSLAPAMSKLLTFFSSSWCTDICSSSSWRTVWAKFQGEKRHKLHSCSLKRGQISKQSKANLRKNITSKLPDAFFKCNFKTNMLMTYFLDLPFQKKKKAVELRLLHHRILLELLDFNSMLLHVQVHLLCSERLKQIFKKDDTRIVSSFCLLKWCLLKL